MSPPHSPPQPPPTASPTYKALHATALAFIAAQSHDPSLPNRMNIPQIKSLCTPTFTHSFGHAYAVSLSPLPLQGSLSLDAFTAHLAAMLPRLDSWHARVTDVLVDEARWRVMLRVSYFMRAKGVVDEKEVVENELVWVLGMEKGEDETEMRVASSVEFMDGVAAARLRELIGRGEMAGGGK